MQGINRRELLDRYREGPEVLAASVSGLSEAELDSPAPDGGWTARQVIHHVADSEMTSAIRLRRLLAEDNPLIQGYDEEEFARRLHYEDRPIAPSLEAVRAARQTTADILQRLQEPDWQRAGRHSESGPYSVENWLQIYAAHCHDHAEQIRRGQAR
jgi:hypothetical protein